MSEWKVTASHRSRAAVIYVRQSTLLQVERNRESTARQYDLVSRARELGWPRTAVTVIDEDLGLSGASAAGRAGFAGLAARVGMGQVGIVLSLECSRLARNNALFRYRNKLFCSACGIMPRTVVPFLVKKVSFLAESA
jgi:DNA invertase Pin-like site-specific DNA recombinase